MSGEPDPGDQSAPPPSARGPQLFREEALQRYVRAREFGDVLRLPPRWTRLAYPLVVGLALIAILMFVVGDEPLILTLLPGLRTALGN